MAEKSATQFPEEYYHDPLGLNRYVVQEKELFGWLAPSRVKKQWNKSQLTSLFAVVGLMSIILLLSGEFILTVVFLTAIGVSVLVATTQPSQLHCLVTTIGLKIEDKYYYWEQLTQFWFETKSGTHYLYVRSIWPQIHVVRFIIQPEDERQLKTTIGTYLLFKKPQPTQWQKFSQQFMAKIPFELDLW